MRLDVEYILRVGERERDNVCVCVFSQILSSDRLYEKLYDIVRTGEHGTPTA